MTSAETGPEVILQISLRMSSYEPPTLAYSVGLVVTPSSTPQRAAVRISSMSAVSRKIFIGQAPWCRRGPRRVRRPAILRRRPMTLRSCRRGPAAPSSRARSRSRRRRPGTAVAMYPRSRSPRRRSRAGRTSPRTASAANSSAPGSVPSWSTWTRRGPPKASALGDERRAEQPRRRSPAASRARTARPPRRRP